MGDVFSNINDNLRAYTGHEPVSLGGDKRIIHMNGRIYDSETGRFMQADPVVQAPSNLQNYNAYSYVLNNPLSYTDPSGYLFKKLGKFIKKYWRPMLAIVVAYYTGDWANGLELFTNPIAQGAATGAIAGGAAGAVGSGSLKGALTGAATGAAFGAIGANFTGAAEGSFEHIASHALAGGVLAEIQGQNFGHGFWSAGLTKGMDVNGFMPGVGAGMNMARTLVAGIIGGTVSELVGGKFANGAVTAAFAQAFNGNSFWDRAQEYGELALELAPGYDLAMCMRAAASCSTTEWAMAMADFTPLAGIAKAKKAYNLVDKVTDKGLGSTRKRVREYLNNIEDVPREQLVKDLEKAGFEKVFDGNGMQHFQRGKWKVRIDPPHGKTDYNHMHINRGGNKNAFDKNLKPVSHKSPDAHISIQ
ncbi:RHS repeat-associated core domain-containing protein [Pseudoalteromonas sp. R3]|nr:RHS repeat-associated core domain-containing protein [Pseudoalteromonas sp. R3]